MKYFFLSILSFFVFKTLGQTIDSTSQDYNREIENQITNEIVIPYPGLDFGTDPFNGYYHLSDFEYDYFDYINPYFEDPNKRIIFDLNENKFIIPPMETINQEHSIEVLVQNVNLFLYSAELSEIQNDFISNENLSEAKYKNSFSPFNYNLNDVYIDLSAFDIKSFSGTQDLRDIESQIAQINTNIKTIEEDLIRANERVLELEKFRIEYFVISEDINSEDDKEKKNELTLKLIGLYNKYDMNQDNASTVDNSIKEFRRKIEELRNKKKEFQISFASKQRELEILRSESTDLNVLLNNYSTNVISYQESIEALNRTIIYYERLLCLLYSDEPFPELLFNRNNMTFEEFGATNTQSVLNNLFERIDNIKKDYTDVLVSHQVAKSKVIEKDANGNMEGIDQVLSNVKASYNSISF
jgi:chromosome segregation ATPase